MGSATSATRIGLDTGGRKLRNQVGAAAGGPAEAATATRARVRRLLRPSGDLRHELRTPLSAPPTAVDLLDRRREDGSRQVQRVAAAAADPGPLFTDSPVSRGAVTAGRRCPHPGTGPSPAAGAAAAGPGGVDCEERRAESGVSISEFRLFKEGTI
ncbi:hypothetical protein [Nocardia fusca]|uniref:hypothetical protein n=1 Tax=Nocardia fusca TaxID=941183 RepID=UPI0007A742EA|nr:hypothetical protein [Nocardia fusca]